MILAPSRSCVQHYRILISFCISPHCLAFFHPGIFPLFPGWAMNAPESEMIWFSLLKEWQVETAAAWDSGHMIKPHHRPNCNIKPLKSKPGLNQNSQACTSTGALASRSTEQQSLGHSIPWYIQGMQLTSSHSTKSTEFPELQLCYYVHELTHK